MTHPHETVEWDYTHAVVLNVKSGHAEPSSTGIPRRPTSRTRWLPVEIEYPDDYLPNFPEMLGPGVYDLKEDGTLRKYFPHPDFSIESVRNRLLDMAGDFMRYTLGSTDTYLFQEMETGTPMPAEIKQMRDRIRAEGKKAKEDIRKAAPADLVNMDLGARFDALPHDPPRYWTPPGRPGEYIHGQGQPGDRPSSLRPGEEPAPPIDPALTEPPDPSINGAPIEDVEGR